MSDATFDALAALLKARSGLIIGPDKLYLLDTRLGPIMKREGLRDLAALAARVRRGALFVDDLLPNLDSAAEHAPAVARFQMIADPALRAIAPVAPDRHRRVDDWGELVEAARALFR